MILAISSLGILVSVASKSVTHPISFMMIILIQSLIICLISTFMIPSPCFAIVLFLIFLGGVLVLFIYMSSLASNENFLMSIKEFMVSLTMFSLMILVTYLYLPLSQIFLSNKSLMFISSLYSFKIYNMYIVFILYLLLTLLIVSNVVKKNKAPMRSLN